MAITLGKPLLRSGRALKHHLKRIERQIAEQVYATFLYEPRTDPDELRREMERQYRLEPLVLGRLRSVSVFVEPRGFRSSDGVTRGFVAEARVPYHGSPALWPVRPDRELSFPYWGVPAKASVALRAYTPNKDLAPFEAEVEEVLARTRASLAAFAPRVMSFNPWIRSQIDFMIRTL